MATFGDLLWIPEESLVRLANRVRPFPPQDDAIPTDPPSGRMIDRLCGLYNLVHIIQLQDGFKLVIRIPATGWGDNNTAEAKMAMKSQVTTLRLLAEETSVPVPSIYHFDTTSDNEIGAPYICMSFVHGKMLLEVWFDQTLPTPLDERRLRTLRDVGFCMAELDKFSFAKIGSLLEDDNGELIVGPCYEYAGGVPARVASTGPYDTAAEF